MAMAHDSDDPNDRRAATLGDVIYADRAAVAPEAEWVALVQRIATGDQQAFRALYERTHRLVFTLSVRVTQNRETAEEVAVDVFYGLWTRARSYDPACGTVIGWIMNQTRSRAIDRLRYEQRKKRASPEGGLSPEAMSAEFSDVPMRDAHPLREALKTLTADERQAIETAFFAELTYGEVAERLGQPVGTIKTRIRSGLAKLRRLLAQREHDL
jgi:RNA polymerase sigma-70 factor, ECF subfamily